MTTYKPKTKQGEILAKAIELLEAAGFQIRGTYHCGYSNSKQLNGPDRAYYLASRLLVAYVPGLTQIDCNLIRPYVSQFASSVGFSVRCVTCRDGSMRILVNPKFVLPD